MLSSQGSTEFVQSILSGAMCGGSTGQAGPYVGGFQDLAAPDYSEPSGGWRWVDGSLFPGSAAISLDDNLGHQDYVHFISLRPSCSGPFVLDDVGLVSNANRSFIVEWSADCNHDSIVDYGQCHDGTLPDYNGNNIPDSCEVPTGWVVVADSVAEYTTTQGANGWHYLYDTGAGTSVVPMAYVVTSEFPPFMPAWCTHPAFGGNGSYCSIDQIQCHTSTPSHCSSASAGLERPHRRWINSSAVKGTVLISGYFGATAGFTTRLQVFADGQLVFEQVASPAATPGNTTPIGAVVNLPPTSVLDVVVDPNDGSCHADRVEYSVRVIGADCNGDGIVDYGQVMTGQLADLNGNTVPDICEGPNCHDADLYPNNRIDGADLGILLSEWGPVNPSTNSDINHDSFVNGADLGILLSFWGACQN